VTKIKISKTDQKILDSRIDKHIRDVEYLLENANASSWAKKYWTAVRDKLLLKLSEQGKLKNSKYVN